MKLAYCYGNTELGAVPYPPETKQAVFVVPVTEDIFRSGAFDYSDTLMYAIHAGNGSNDCDTLNVYGFSFETIPVTLPDPLRDKPPVAMTRITVHYLLSESEERKHLTAFIRELHALQAKFGFSLEPDSPMLTFIVNKNPAYRSLMCVEGNRITISRPWGG